MSRNNNSLTMIKHYIFSIARRGEWPVSLWIILLTIVLIGAAAFLIGMYASSRIKKSKRIAPIQPNGFPSGQLRQPQPPQISTPVPPEAPLVNTPVGCPTDEPFADLQPDAGLYPDNDETTALCTDDGSKPLVLIIEDHNDICLYLSILLNKEYELLIATNGEEGLKLARRKLPDLIITDVMMPLMDGFECCKRLKEDLKTCHIPIIMLTALSGDENIVKGIELGADDYIMKPFNPKILKTKARQLIKSRQELKRLYSKLFTPSVTEGPEEVVENIEKTKEDPFIAQIIEIVENNLQNPQFSVKRLSEMLNMSQPTLYRRVKLLTNFTIIELVRGVRLKRSAELLKSRQYNVQEVAEMVGYNDIPTFRKHFIDFYGTTPSTFWRDQN